MSGPLLSKTRFQSGRQCLRRLWLGSHQPDLAEPYGPVTLARFEAGAEVGVLARECFPGGTLITARPWEHHEAVVRTTELLDAPNVPAIFEAGFLHDGVQVRSDVVARGANCGWRLIEVKSSTQPKDEHFYDLALQWHVLAGCGISIECASVMHINNGYVYDGQRHNPHELFRVSDVTPEVEPVRAEVPSLLARQKEIVAEEREPAIPPGPQCFSPYSCPFFRHCAPDKSEHWIAYLPGLKPERFAQLAAQGIEEISQIPDGFRLTAKQRKVCDSVHRAKPWVSACLRETMARLTPPLLFFDFETINPAIPRYAGTRPYQQIPFQWSLHIVERDERISHQEFLVDPDDDPRRPVAESLLKALKPEGAIVVYNARFEIGIIEQLARDLPDLAPRLLSLLDRIVDLFVVVRECYDHPDLLGSYSLKRVVPALVPDADYGDLAIQEGETASVIYLQMLAETDPKKREELRRDLLEYCKRDTRATVRIWQELRRLAPA